MNTERPVALLHSYLNDREELGKPDRLTRIGILAAAELYRRGEIGKICITVKPELSDAQVARLNILLNNPPAGDLVVRPQAVTTREEVNTFADLAEENGWKTLVAIGNTIHLPRIRKEAGRVFGGKGAKIETRSSQEILSAYPRYSSILGEMENWPEQKSFGFYERILSTPILGKLLISSSPIISKIKIGLQSWLLETLEKGPFI